MQGGKGSSHKDGLLQTYLALAITFSGSSTLAGAVCALLRF